MPKLNRKKGNKIESESITLRVEKDVLSELRSEAEQRMESLNTLSNQILKSYVIWHKPANKAGIVYTPKTLLTDVFEMLTEEQIIQVTENWVKKHSKDIMIMMDKDYKLTSFLDGFKVYLDLSGFNYTRHEDGSFEQYIIKFEMGKKFNFHMGKYLQFLFLELQIKDVHFEITDYAVMFRFKIE
jgi:hypothetical protein